MNNLSILIYLSDVLPRLIPIIIPVAVITVLVCIIFYSERSEIYQYDQNEQQKRRDEFTAKNFKYVKMSIIACIMSLVLVFVVPKRDTILLIAGSEAAEAVVTSTEGAEILSDIKLILKQKLQTFKKD